MARTLSDSIIICMVEAATRLAGARGPIAGAAAAMTQSEGAVDERGGRAGQATGQATGQAPATRSSSGHDGAASPLPAEQDARTAEQIGADFKTIYAQIEEVVRASAEQETKSVGFNIR